MLNFFNCLVYFEIVILNGNNLELYVMLLKINFRNKNFLMFLKSGGIYYDIKGILCIKIIKYIFFVIL